MGDTYLLRYALQTIVFWAAALALPLVTRFYVIRESVRSVHAWGLAIFNAVLVFAGLNIVYGPSKPPVALFYQALISYYILRKESKEQTKARVAALASPKIYIEVEEYRLSGIMPNRVSALRILKVFLIILLAIAWLALLFVVSASSMGTYESETVRIETTMILQYICAVVTIPWIMLIAWISRKIKYWRLFASEYIAPFKEAEAEAASESEN